jgi:UTP--glucose-1-phosphate uridylyltransferase
VFREQGKVDQLGRLAPPAVKVSFVRQLRMGGTGDAILLAREFAGRDPLVVAFPDDLLGPPNATAALLAAHAATGDAVLGVADLSGQDVSAYGVVDGVDEGGGLWRVRDVVEKPTPGTEPSHLASLGRFVYTPDLLDALAASAKGHAGGELYPMAAMREVAGRGGLVAKVLTGTRWDTGTPLGYLQAVVDHGLADPRIGAAFGTWLRGRVG